MAIIYNKDGEQVIIDDAQMDEWLGLGYFRENPLNNPVEPDEFIPVIMIKEGEKEKTVDTQKAYDKALKQGWVVKDEI